MRRRVDHKVFAGVAGGIADVVQVDPLFVRLAFVVLTPASGLGLLLYAVLWIVLPQHGEDLENDSADEGSSGIVRALAFGSIVLGVLLLIRQTGIWFPDGLLWPVVLTASGLSMTWRRNDSSEEAKDRWRTAAQNGVPGLVAQARSVLSDDSWSRRSMWRLVAGAALVFLGAATFLATSGSFTALRQGLVASLVFLAGISLLVAPWLIRLVQTADKERRERIRSEERAMLAAHLHDSVLQTLAIIQKKASNPREVTLLARRQERELRTWLYDGTEAVVDQPTTLSQAIAGVADSVEADHGVVIEVVQVGDAEMDERVTSLVSAAREAMVNAAKHSGAAEISVFAEVDGPSGDCDVFVRDRGIGFDQKSIAKDRRGVRDSLKLRMERIDGSATIHSELGEGTEVHLHLSLAPLAAAYEAPAALRTTQQQPEFNETSTA